MRLAGAIGGRNSVAGLTKGFHRDRAGRDAEANQFVTNNAGTALGQAHIVGRCTGTVREAGDGHAGDATGTTLVGRLCNHCTRLSRQR